MSVAGDNDQLFPVRDADAVIQGAQSGEAGDGE